MNAHGEEVGTKEILTGFSHVSVTPELLHQVVVAAAANARVPRAHTKTRGEVRGGGRKPWRQKGTGRARHGSIRSPIWKGGGTTFGPRADRSYAKRLPVSMRRTALAHALVAKAAAGELVFLDPLPETPKTALWAKALSHVRRSGSVLLAISGNASVHAARGVRNLPNVHVLSAKDLTAANLLTSRTIVLSPGSWEILEGRLAS